MIHNKSLKCSCFDVYGLSSLRSLRFLLQVFSRVHVSTSAVTSNRSGFSRRCIRVRAQIIIFSMASPSKIDRLDEGCAGCICLHHAYLKREKTASSCDLKRRMHCLSMDSDESLRTAQSQRLLNETSFSQKQTNKMKILWAQGSLFLWL